MSISNSADKHLQTGEPFFARDASVRRVHREGVLLLGGGRALLMQIAYPAVAQGVAEHSRYQTDRTARLLRTLQGILALVYGTHEEASKAAAGINRIHGHVNGEDYTALDPKLLVWVLSTLIDTAVEMHERFLGPIEAAELSRYYEEMVALGGHLGIPAGAMPPDIDAMREYVDELCRTLSVTPQARRIAEHLFLPLPGTGPAMALMRQCTAGVLHPHLRDGYGLTWGPAREAQLRVLQSLSRRVLPRLPLPIRATPAFLLPPSAR